MALLLATYTAVSLLLFSIAIYEQTIISIMSLPISTTATTCIILLPVLAFLNTLFCTARSRPAHPASRQFAQYLLPPTLQILQTIITTILGTIFLSDVIPSAARQCLLSSRWQDLWVAHNSAAIRRIQDTHNCCGFNSVKDRAWPFPTGDKTEPGCATQFGRTTACATPWTKAMRTAAGVEFGVVLGVGALQVFNILLLRCGSSLEGRSGGFACWMPSIIKRLTGDDGDSPDGAGLNEPLLGDGPGLCGDADQGLSNPSGTAENEADARLLPGRHSYGATRAALTGARTGPHRSTASPWAVEDDEGSDA